MPELSFAIEKSGAGDKLSFAGAVKDGADAILREAAASVTSGQLVIDCSGLESMSSLGAATWLRFIEGLLAHIAVTYVRCPIFFVDYLNMFDAFRQGVKIQSVEVPYACPVCGYQGTVELELAGVDPAKELAEVDCPECSALMSAQVAAEDYLTFME